MNYKTELQTNRCQINKNINTAYQLVNKQFNYYDQAYISVDQSLFVTDYLFSNFEVDHKKQQTIIKEIQQMAKSQKKQLLRRDDLKSYLSQNCLECPKREQQILLQEQKLINILKTFIMKYIQQSSVVDYIDINLIKEIEKLWAIFKEQEIYFLTKEKTIELIKILIKKYKIKYSDVSEQIDKYLNRLYKHVFLDDFICIIIEIGRDHNLQQKKYIEKKQNCGCTIF
ncbi:hypothetical protein ABPG74_014540 [Tetrahymena malaccensis]